MIYTKICGNPNIPNTEKTNPPEINWKNNHKIDRTKNVLLVIWFSMFPVPLVELCTLLVTFATIPPCGFVG